METKTENILNVSVLPPQLKHPTIFARFDELSGGENLIIHNDHDPKPLYYHLLSERGNIFTWEYLEDGPELFRIKISKNKEAMPEQEEVEKFNEPENLASASEKENILNVSIIEPKLKHPTIFVRFDELVAGESLTIHNDHDPKPLYYQLLGERGNIFTWEYLEEGPDLWRVKISKKLSGEDDETLGEIAVKDLRKAEVFKKYGLDFCCGGKKTVKQACAEKGLDVTKVEQELQAADTNVSNSRPLPYNDWNLDFLADYIVNTHHSYVRKTLPDLRSFSTKVASVHGGNHPELFEISRLVEQVCQELSEHMVSEENILFKYVKHIVAAKNNNSTSVKFENYDCIQTPIDMLEMEHDAVGNSMETIRELSNNYTLPEDSCASYSYLYKTLVEFESDLFTHIHLENNILFPKAIEMEKKIG
jgi:regulator of cell morphogenesis and NO signaling